MGKNAKQIREIKNVRTIIKMVKSDEVGWFEYKGKTIFIGYRKGKDALGQTREQRLYGRRRSLGLCVACGGKVKKKNPQTGKLYRLCDYHRKKFDQKKIRPPSPADQESGSIKVLPGCSFKNQLEQYRSSRV